MSICNLEHNLVYIHIPKTAGTSLEHAPFIGGGGHQPIEYFKRAFELSFRGLPDWEEIFKFAFVRHPFTRYLSAVLAHYLDPTISEFAGDLGGKEYPITPEGVTKFTEDNFERIKNLRWFEWVHLVPQYKFVCIDTPGGKGLGWGGEIEVDFVGRFENLQEDWQKVCERVGQSWELEHWRKGKYRDDYDKYLTTHLRQMLRELYERDFELFNYE